MFSVTGCTASGAIQHGEMGKHGMSHRYDGYVAIAFPLFRSSLTYFFSLSPRRHNLHIKPHASILRDLYVLNFDPIKYCSKPFSRARNNVVAVI